MSLADLRSGYNLTGERQLTRAKATEDQASQLAEAGIALRHERSFTATTSATDQPDVVLASVTVYEDKQTAAVEYESLTAPLADQGSAESITVLNGFSAEAFTFENAEGDQNTLIARQSGQIVYYVVTSDSTTEYPTVTRELFITMLRGETTAQ